MVRVFEFKTYCGLETPQNMVAVSWDDCCKTCARARRKYLEKYLQEARIIDEFLNPHNG